MTFILETIRLGLTNLRLHLLRSVLTALGIILGVGAVITMAALGEGTKREAFAQIERLGARNIIINSQKPPETQQQQQGQQRSFLSRFGLTRDDLAVIRENFPDADGIVPLKETGSQVIRGALRKTSQAFGTTPALPDAAKFQIARGRYLTDRDLEERAMVAVIGDNIVKDFFPLDDPLGSTIRIDQKAFTVIGVIKPIGLAGGRGGALVGRDMNNDIHVPITTATAVFGDTVVRGGSGSLQANAVQVSSILLTSASMDRVMTDAARVKRILDQRRGQQADYTVIVPFELLEEARRQAFTLNIVFGSIAGIALLVGGIGIMNIMLASVTERTREIGIRRAVGATRKHILSQFLVETSVLTTLGGLMGIGLGIGFSYFLQWVVPKLPDLPVIGAQFDRDGSLPAQVTVTSIIIAFGVAAATGIVFGLYPARKAAQQDPIVALRHD
jgi:putative ABC transport system permease protein